MPVEWLCFPGYKPISWNISHGCTKISEGCLNCWADRLSHTRLKGKAGYPSDNPFKVTMDYSRMDDFSNVQRPHSIFVVSMGDLMHDELPDSFIAQVFSRMISNPQHLYFVLTKRVSRLVKFVNGFWGNDLEDLKHIWFGVTAENQKRYDERVPVLCSLNTNNLFISCEPLLSDIDLRLSDVKLFPNRKPSWVIVGGESGPNCRKMELDWVRCIHAQCVQHKIPCYVKQLGGFPDQRERNKAILDGRLYKEFPVLTNPKEGLQQC